MTVFIPMFCVYVVFMFTYSWTKSITKQMILLILGDKSRASIPLQFAVSSTL